MSYPLSHTAVNKKKKKEKKIIIIKIIFRGQSRTVNNTNIKTPYHTVVTLWWNDLSLEWIFELVKQELGIRKRRTDNTMGKKKKYKKTNNDLQNITHKTKDRVIQTPLKTGGELRCFGRVSSSCFTSSKIHSRHRSFHHKVTTVW
jgi:uncharacterized protein (UPF0333 family)